VRPSIYLPKLPRPFSSSTRTHIHRRARTHTKSARRLVRSAIAPGAASPSPPPPPRPAPAAHADADPPAPYMYAGWVEWKPGGPRRRRPPLFGAAAWGSRCVRADRGGAVRRAGQHGQARPEEAPDFEIVIPISKWEAPALSGASSGLAGPCLHGQCGYCYCCCRRCSAYSVQCMHPALTAG
jgi:hypothetical protein